MTSLGLQLVGDLSRQMEWQLGDSVTSRCRGEIYRDFQDTGSWTTGDGQLNLTQWLLAHDELL
jgi:hypothetical protein